MKTVAPRRIWIDLPYGRDPEDWGFHDNPDLVQKGQVAYVPVSCYDREMHLRKKAETEIERLESNYRQVLREVNDQSVMLLDRAAEIERLRDALEFYADPETYFGIVVIGDPPCGAFVEDFSDDHGHPYLDGPRHGKTARAALAGKEIKP